MQTAINYNELLCRLNDTFSNLAYRDIPNQTRMIGIVFTKPSSGLGKSEIIPQIHDWHFRSGKNIDFYFSGYTTYHPPIDGYVKVDIPGMENWVYGAKQFDLFRREIESKTKWKYSGGSDLILTNAKFDSTTKKTTIDFASTLCCQLDALKKDQAIQSVELFFEQIFQFADTQKCVDPTYSFSDVLGGNIAGSAFKRFLLSLFPTTLGSDIKKIEHFAVKNVGR